MGFFSQTTKVVDLGGGNSVTLRSLTFGERQELQSRCMKIGASMNGKNSGAEAAFDVALMQRLTWQKAISAWDGPGFEGRPVTAENIDALPAWLLDQLTPEYNSLEGLSAEEKKG